MKAFLTNEWMLENRVHKKFIFKKKTKKSTHIESLDRRLAPN
jgi:hypothetical protein